MVNYVRLRGEEWIFSGAEGAAVASVAVESAMTAGTELDPGGVVSSRLELRLFPGDLTVQAGDPVELFDESKTLLGTFTAKEPTRKDGLLILEGLDKLSLLDRDVTDWLSAQGEELTLQSLAEGLCAHCGLTLSAELPHYRVQPFSARGITGRQLMEWIAQAAGCFCAADPEGTVTFRWLNHRALAIGPTGDHFYYQGSLTLSDFDTAPVDRIRIGLTERDLGVTYPREGENTLHIHGNYLLTGDNDALARTLYERLSGFSYAPCVFETATAIAPGDVFTVAGRQTVAMAVEMVDGRYRVTATGSADRAAGTLAGSTFRALNGRMLEAELSLQGVELKMTEFRETQTAVASITQDVEEMEAKVALLEEQEASIRESCAALKLTSDALEVSVGTVERSLEEQEQTLSQVTERFRFDENGMTISDSATGMSILVSQEEIAFSGTTRICPDAMDTTNLSVGRSLTLGDFVWIPRTNGNLSFRWIGGNG